MLVSVGSSPTKVDRVIEVDQVEHALDDVHAGLGGGGAERGEHGRPARADDDVGHGLAAGAHGLGQATPVTPAWSAIRSGVHARLMCADTVLHLRKLLPRSDTQQCRHRRLGVGLGHDGGAAVTDGDGHRDADLDGLALRERHGQIDVLGVGDDEAGAVLSWLATVSDSIVHSSTAPRRRTGFCVIGARPTGRPGR